MPLRLLVCVLSMLATKAAPRNRKRKLSDFGELMTRSSACRGLTTKAPDTLSPKTIFWLSRHTTCRLTFWSRTLPPEPGRDCRQVSGTGSRRCSDLDGDVAWRGFAAKHRVSIQSQQAECCHQPQRCLAVIYANPRLLEVSCNSIEQMRLVNTLCWAKVFAESAATRKMTAAVA